MEYYAVNTDSYLQHFGVKGMHWGIRRYENEDGSLTPAGRRRYKVDSYAEKKYVGERKRALDQAKATSGKKSQEYAKAKADLRSAKQYVGEQKRIRRSLNNNLTDYEFHSLKTKEYADPMKRVFERKDFTNYDPTDTAQQYLSKKSQAGFWDRLEAKWGEQHRTEAIKSKAVVDDLLSKLDKNFSVADDNSLKYREYGDYAYTWRGTSYTRRK